MIFRGDVRHLLVQRKTAASRQSYEVAARHQHYHPCVELRSGRAAPSRSDVSADHTARFRCLACAEMSSRRRWGGWLRGRGPVVREGRVPPVLQAHARIVAFSTLRVESTVAHAGEQARADRTRHTEACGSPSPRLRKRSPPPHSSSRRFSRPAIGGHGVHARPKAAPRLHHGRGHRAAYRARRPYAQTRTARLQRLREDSAIPTGAVHLVSREIRMSLGGDTAGYGFGAQKRRCPCPWIRVTSACVHAPPRQDMLATP